MKLYINSIGRLIHYWYGVEYTNGPCYLTLLNATTDFYLTHQCSYEYREII